jgi:CheY-like chemotaxis protein
MGRKELLVVEDERDIAELLVHSLIARGFRVEHAPHGQAAWDILCQAPSDLVLTDLLMPVMDGCELVRRIRGSPRLAATPIVVLSALPEGVMRTSCPSADAFLQKPFQLKHVLDRIARLLGSPANTSPEPWAGTETASGR